jgi:hypothetical protein
LSLAFTSDKEQIAKWIDDIGGLEFQIGDGAASATNGG